MDEQKSETMQIILHDLTYADGEEDPFEALETTLAFSSDDWSTSRAKAWVWGIICGWDDASMAELAAKFGWDQEAVARLNRLHAKFKTGN
jgi:hypothetical protein